MNTSQLKQFAQNARRQLIELISTKLTIVLDAGSAARRGNEKAVKDLEKEISRTSEDQVIEKVAYIWFNRFCALRFMDANRYTPIGVVSPAEGFSQPEILMEAKQGHIDAGLRIDKGRVFGLLNETIPSPEPQQEAYRILLVAVCNDYNSIMPFLFEKIADYTELLMPDDLLSDSSILTATREALSDEACADVEVIGWLYQFYISEKKDEVFAGLKKNKKVTPKNIPAATQLFTPNWIVRYLVENSLGRLWMLNNPASRLVDKMEYYIKPEKEETDFLIVKSPEEIKICDPACGSGHMLVYAFEILYSIYEEEGYDAPKIPQFIFENNLYGIEIDERAGELAAFALCMKAREKYRRFFKKNIQPNICVLENVSFEAHEIKSYLDAVNPDLFTTDLQTLLYQFKEADNFGSLIRPELTNISDVLRLLDVKKVSDDMFLQNIHKRVLQVLDQAEYLSPKYHVVVANPPYMGGKGMNRRLGTWISENYTDVKSDLFSAFILRNTELTLPKGQLGFMSPFVWMFISSYEKLRNFLINEKIITSLVQLEYSGFDGATVPICTFTIENTYNPEFRGGYVRLSDFRGSDNQGPRTLEAIKNHNCDWFYRASSTDFKKVPGCPIVYWSSKSIMDLFRTYDSFDKYGETLQGMTTCDNDFYIRYWWEVESLKIGRSYTNRNDAKQSKKKWFPYTKGGAKRKWYGNNEYIVNWENDGELLRTRKHPTKDKIWAHNFNLDYIFNEGASYSSLSSGKFSCRYTPPGFLFDQKGSMIFASDNNIKIHMGLFNSTLTTKILELLCPTLDFNPGALLKIPISYDSKKRSVSNQAIELSKKDWDSYEFSPNFSKNSLLRQNKCHGTINSSYLFLKKENESLVAHMRDLEEENNTIVIKNYCLQEELSSEILISEITLTCNADYNYPDTAKKIYSKEDREKLVLADTMKEFISYSVGCMFGRYSLDKDGLILANQGETLETYLARIPEPTFKPDDDNVIPIMDVDWFTDDIAERFKKFLKVTFGEEHYTENLEFIEKAIGKDIRKYFLKSFYADHVRKYKKRPIYWMFSSPKGSFNALIYLHRYRPDTVSIILNDYLREFKTKLAARKDNLENISISTSASQGGKTKALKEIEKIKKVLDEVDEYERDVLYPLATKQIEIDLDDGVKVNYPKFGKALKKIAGLS